jgi:tetratricopeptide (TPR) repeat protein
VLPDLTNISVGFKSEFASGLQNDGRLCEESAMFKIESELIILIFGLASVLAGLEHISDVGRKRLILKIVFAVGLSVQALAHFLQYHNAVTNQKQVEADTAMALHAFSHRDFGLLEKTSRDPYIVAYYLWKEGNSKEAVYWLNKAISEGKYVASSNYLLAVFFSQDDSGDLKDELSEAHRYLRRAIANNPDYAPAYYLQAQLYVNGKQVDEALEVLEKAVLPDRIGRLPCAGLNAPPNGKRDVWQKARERQKFKELQEKCRVLHGLETTSAGKT